MVRPWSIPLYLGCGRMVVVWLSFCRLCHLTKVFFEKCQKMTIGARLTYARAHYAHIRSRVGAKTKISYILNPKAEPLKFSKFRIFMLSIC